jgi:hypothetical protein
MRNVPNVPYLPSSNNYCTVQQSTNGYHCTNSTLVKGNTTRPTGRTVMKVNHGTILEEGTGPGTSRLINKHET